MMNEKQFCKKKQNINLLVADALASTSIWKIGFF